MMTNFANKMQYLKRIVRLSHAHTKKRFTENMTSTACMIVDASINMVLMCLIFGCSLCCTRERKKTLKFERTVMNDWVTLITSWCGSHVVHKQTKHNGSALHMPINNLISLWNVLRATIRIASSKVLSAFVWILIGSFSDTNKIKSASNFVFYTIHNCCCCSSCFVGVQLSIK